jgi:dihydrolipoamide dehydrogenase
MLRGQFDLIVIGAGSGLRISSAAAEAGWKVAVIDEGPFGGTCLNRGCIPSKAFIHVADVMQDIRRASDYGIKAKATAVDWPRIVKRIMGEIDGDAKSIEQGNKATKNITVFKTRGVFVGPKQVKVGKQIITAPRIVIAAGTRPSIPSMQGLDKVGYLTSDDIFRLKKLPKSMIFIGGGYIACELAHMFDTLGTKVTVIQRSGVLLGREDREVATRFTEVFTRNVDVRLNATTNRVFKKGKLFAIEIQQGKKKQVVSAETLVVATGRKPNTDVLDVAKTGIAVDKNGYLQVDEFMRTEVDGIWAIGDIAGKWMFKHSANLEADVCAHNLLGTLVRADYTAMPHAIFSSPQLAGVGMTEEELVEKGIRFIKGSYDYKDTGYGMALMEEDGFAKVLVDPRTRRILGCHIVGPYASMIIHEVIVAMKAGMTADALAGTIHIHPALNEVVQRALLSLE